MKIRVNADDFGISPGVNWAVKDMFKRRKLNSASLMCGVKYFSEAVLIAKRNPELEIGLHFNVTTGFSVRKVKEASLLVDQNGKFKNGFLKLVLLAIFKRKKLMLEVAEELKAQLDLIQSAGLKLSHIDSHRHIHMIFGIFDVVIKVAKEYNIKKVRVVNESLIQTFFINHPKSFWINGNIIKWLILSLFRLVNGQKGEEYFFSILYTCEISSDLISKIKVPRRFVGKTVEIMIHPAKPEIDEKISDLEEKKHLLSRYRNLEFF